MGAYVGVVLCACQFFDRFVDMHKCPRWVAGLLLEESKVLQPSAVVAVSAGV